MTETDEEPGTARRSRFAIARGPGASAIGTFVVVIGAAVAKAFSWNWSLFLLVLALTSVAIKRSPGGPGGESVAVLLVCGLAVLAAGRRLIDIGRLGPGPPTGRRATVSALSLTLAISGLVWSEELRDHGDVDVRGGTSISRAVLLDGTTAAVVVDRVPARARLRLEFTVSDADAEAQSCRPVTRLDVGVGTDPHSAHTDVRSGSPVDIRLGGQRRDARLRITLHTARGCRMNVSIAEAVAHD